ncbi:sulfatase-like hydrolase/transferase [Rhodopirellula sp.]|nr:sulfatase-like hydrolase/transferase [Rhodopirellula sp.]
MNFRRTILCTFLILMPACCVNAQKATKPNFVYIMADELGYFEPGFMGGKQIQTPRLDQMAKKGMQFTQLLAGSSVCAPTRCTLMTGKHSGHSSVRKNGGGTPLRADETTIASLLKANGYATGGFGKWGCGGRGSTGVPEKHGFDIFLGYYDQVHAHTYYPPYLIRNSKEVPLANNFGMSNGDQYSQYIIHDAAKSFIRQNAEQPFFAYLPYTPPHGLFDIPETDPAWLIYKDRQWPDQAKKYAAMVTMLDRQVGEIIDLLRELHLEENTLVIFSGDNGGADYFSSKDYPRGFHQANIHPESGIEFRGKKGNLYEGGLRIPFVAYWPGKIKSGETSDHLGYFPDIMPTFAEITGIDTPRDIDGISFAATLLGEDKVGHPQNQHDYLYWEIGSWTAIRQNNWRAVRSSPQSAWELYDLESDISEKENLATVHRTKLTELIQLADSAHEPEAEGIFHSTVEHERDRRAKAGRHDAANGPSEKSRLNGKVETMPAQGLLKNSGWKIIEVSSENRANNKLALNAIDGDPTTWWHTKFSDGKAAPPHVLTIDLVEEAALRGIVYMCRQDRSRNGAVKDFSIELSLDGNQFQKVLESTFDLSTKPQTKIFPRTNARYIRVVCETDFSGENFAAISELGFLIDGE